MFSIIFNAENVDLDLHQTLVMDYKNNVEETTLIYFKKHLNLYFLSLQHVI